MHTSTDHPSKINIQENPEFETSTQGISLTAPDNAPKKDSKIESEMLPLEDSMILPTPPDDKTQPVIYISPIYCFVAEHREIFEAALSCKVGSVLMLHKALKECKEDNVNQMPLGYYYNEESVIVTPLVVLCQSIAKNYSERDQNNLYIPTALNIKEAIEIFQELIDFYVKEGIGEDGVHHLNRGGKKAVAHWFDTAYESWGKDDILVCEMRKHLQSYSAITNLNGPKKVSQHNSKWDCLFAFLHKKPTPISAMKTKTAAITQSASPGATILAPGK